MWTISFALGPCTLTSFESGAGLGPAESRDRKPSFNNLLWSNIHRLHGKTLKSGEAASGGKEATLYVQNGRLLQKGAGGRKSSALLWKDVLGQHRLGHMQDLGN